jgi:hypothetical protein
MTEESSQRKNEKLVVLAKFDNPSEAHRLRAELEANGIRASVTNENSANAIGASLFGRIAAISVEVLILDADLERAVEIKNNYLNNRKETPIPEWTCQCGETVDAGFSTCWACGAEYRENK